MRRPSPLVRQRHLELPGERIVLHVHHLPLGGLAPHRVAHADAERHRAAHRGEVWARPLAMDDEEEVRIPADVAIPTGALRLLLDGDVDDLRWVPRDPSACSAFAPAPSPLPSRLIPS